MTGLGSPYKEMKGPLSYSKSYLSIFPLKLLWFFSFPSLFYHVGSSFSHPFWINCYNLASVYSAHLTTNLQQKQHPNHVYHSTTCYGSQVLTGLNPLFILVFSLQRSGPHPAPVPAHPAQISAPAQPAPHLLPARLGSFPPPSGST